MKLHPYSEVTWILLLFMVIRNDFSFDLIFNKKFKFMKTWLIPINMFTQFIKSISQNFHVQILYSRVKNKQKHLTESSYFSIIFSCFLFVLGSLYIILYSCIYLHLKLYQEHRSHT